MQARHITAIASTAAGLLAACGIFSEDDYEPRPGTGPVGGGGNRSRDDGGVEKDEGGVIPPPAPEKLSVVVEGDYVAARGNALVFSEKGSSFVDGRSMPVYSDSTVFLYGRKAYLLQRWGEDSLKCLDVDTGSSCFNFGGVEQIDFEDNSNPQAVVVKDGFAYVSLNHPAISGDVVKIDLATGLIAPDRFDFTSFMNPDGDMHSFAGSMVAVGGTLFILLGDLQSDYYANTDGKLGEIYTGDEDNLRVFPLTECLNPVGIAHAETGELFFSCAGNFFPPEGRAVGFFDLNARIVGGYFIGHEELYNRFLMSGSPGDIEISGRRGFFTLNFTNQDDFTPHSAEVRSFDVDRLVLDPEPWHFSDGGFIGDLAVGSTLMVADRGSTLENSGTFVYDLETRRRLGRYLRLDPPVAVATEK